MGSARLCPCQPCSAGSAYSSALHYWLCCFWSKKLVGRKTSESGVIKDPFSVQKDQGLVISKRGCPVRPDFVVFTFQSMTGNKRIISKSMSEVFVDVRCRWKSVIFLYFFLEMAAEVGTSGHRLVFQVLGIVSSVAPGLPSLAPDLLHCLFIGKRQVAAWAQHSTFHGPVVAETLTGSETACDPWWLCQHREGTEMHQQCR